MPGSAERALRLLSLISGPRTWRTQASRPGNRIARRNASPLSTRFASRCACASCLNSWPARSPSCSKRSVDRRAQFVQERVVDERREQHESLLVKLPPLGLGHGTGHCRERRLVGRRLSRLDQLLDRVAESDQLCLAVGAAHEGEAHRQPVALADRNRQARRAGDGRHAVAGAEEVIAQHVVGRPRRRDARRDHRVELVAVERRQQAVLARQPARLLERLCDRPPRSAAPSSAPVRKSPGRKTAWPCAAFAEFQAISASSEACGEPLALRYVLSPSLNSYSNTSNSVSFQSL